MLTVLLTSKGNGTKRLGILTTGAALESLVVVANGPFHLLDCTFCCRRVATFTLLPVQAFRVVNTQARAGVIRNERATIMTRPNCNSAIDMGMNSMTRMLLLQVLDYDYRLVFT